MRERADAAKATIMAMYGYDYTYLVAMITIIMFVHGLQGRERDFGELGSSFILLATRPRHPVKRRSFTNAGAIA